LDHAPGVASDSFQVVSNREHRVGLCHSLRLCRTDRDGRSLGGFPGAYLADAANEQKVDPSWRAESNFTQPILTKRGRVACKGCRLARAGTIRKDPGPLLFPIEMAMTVSTCALGSLSHRATWAYIAHLVISSDHAVSAPHAPRRRLQSTSRVPASFGGPQDPYVPGAEIRFRSRAVRFTTSHCRSNADEWSGAIGSKSEPRRPSHPSVSCGQRLN